MLNFFYCVGYMNRYILTHHVSWDVVYLLHVHDFYASMLLSCKLPQCSRAVGNAARDDKKQRIMRRHLHFVVRDDEE